MIIIIIIIIRGHTLKDCIILPASRLSVGNISLQTDVYEIFSQFSTKFNQNLMEWPLVYMQPTLPQTFMKITAIYIYILYKLYIVCCVGRVEIQIEQTDKQTEVKTEVIINGNDNGD